jgi:hypothetical protein
MSSIGKKLHHFVPRFYLKTWAKKNLIYCLQDGEIFRTNLRNVAAENHFYRLKELSPEDVEFIRGVAIDDSPKELKASHEKLVQCFTLPYLTKRKLERAGLARSEVPRTLLLLEASLFHGKLSYFKSASIADFQLWS